MGQRTTRKKFDKRNPMHRRQAHLFLDKLFDNPKDCTIVIEGEPIARTTEQNKYLHVILRYFATEIGETMERVKTHYFKRVVNPDLFVTEHPDKVTGEIFYELRSTRDLSVEDMKTAIDRFLIWSAQEAGIVLPACDKPDEIQAAEFASERAKIYL
jgi:hypothetical protein